jgi:hypothetical protein
MEVRDVRKILDFEEDVSKHPEYLQKVCEKEENSPWHSKVEG